MTYADKNAMGSLLVDDTTNVHLIDVNNDVAANGDNWNSSGWTNLRGFSGLAALVAGKRVKMNEQRPADEIFQCVRDGDIASVKSIVTRKVEAVHLQDAEGLSSLHYTAKYNRPEILTFLLEAGADVNAKGFDGENALQMAAKFGNTEVAEILLDSNCRVNEKDDQGRTPLHHGCRRGNLDVVTMLVKAGADVNAKDDDLNSPLHLAAIHGNAAICRLLLEREACCNTANISHITPCMHAAAEGHRDVMELLIKKSEDDGCAGLSLLQERDDEGAAAIHFAVQNGQSETLHYCVEMGVDINQTKHNGASPLHIAVANGFTAIAGYVLDNGADPLQRDGDQMTPMHK